MDWPAWLAGFGPWAAPYSDALDMAVVGLLIVGSAAIAWLAGRRLGPPLESLAARLTGKAEHPAANRARAILSYATASLLFVVVGRAAAATPLALVAATVAAAAAIALLAFRLLRLARLGSGLATLLTSGVFLAATAGLLGGLEPLVRALDGVGMTLGSRSFSLLDAFNFILVIGVLVLVTRVATRLIEQSVGRIAALDATQRLLAKKLAGIAVIALVVLIGIDLLGIDLTALAMFSGALGLAVGFGLQKTLGNLIAGLILLMDRSVKPGDVIVVADTFGTVNRIGVRAVSVVTRDGKEHLIPNEQLMVEPVENWSYTNRNVRLHVPVGVSYDCDLALAQRLMIEAAAASPRVLPTPRPTVWLTGFGDSSVNHEILAWIADPEMGVGAVRSDILNRLWVLFKDNGIQIPFPQRDVHVRSLPEAPTEIGAGGEGSPGAA